MAVEEAQTIACLTDVLAVVQQTVVADRVLYAVTIQQKLLADEEGAMTTKTVVNLDFGKARLETVIDKNKKKVLILSFISFFVVFIVFLMLRSSVNYKIMSYTQKIKSQINEEQQVYSDTVYEDVQVIRPWYSLDPTKWIYRVTLKDNGEVLVYRYDGGIFLQINY